jgi:hypothetical protein
LGKWRFAPEGTNTERFVYVRTPKFTRKFNCSLKNSSLLKRPIWGRFFGSLSVIEADSQIAVCDFGVSRRRELRFLALPYNQVSIGRSLI